MSNQKITELKSLNSNTIDDADLFPVVDVSSNASPTGETKNVSVAQLVLKVVNSSLDQINFILSDTAKLHHSHSIDDIIQLREKLNSYISSSQIGQPDGIVPLNVSGKISTAYLPDELTGSNFVTTVFGRTGNVSAQAGDYDGFYVSVNDVGVANGVAGLGVDYKVNVSNLPAGDVNGVASLDSSGKVPLGQLPDLVTGSFPVTQFNGRTGAIVPQSNDYESFYISQSGGTLTGPLNVLILPTQPSHSVSKKYADSLTSSLLPLSGGTMTGYTNVPILPTQPSHSVSKEYVDSISSVGNGIYKFSEEDVGGGRRSYDSLVFIDKEYNTRAMGRTTSSKYGPLNAYAPAVTLPLPNGEKAQKVYVTQYNLFIVSDTNKAYSTGRNGSGQCGITGQFNNNIGVPTEVSVSNVKKVAISGDEDCRTFMFLTNDGKVYSAGLNGRGQLGNGTTTSTNASGPVLSIGPGNVFGNPTFTVNDVIGISGDGYESFIALLSTGNVYAVGYGGTGQMGNGTTTATNTTWKQVVVTGGLSPLSNVVKIKGSGANQYGSYYALTSDNKLYSWGYNGGGQLGDGTTVTKNQATLIDSSVSDFWVFTTSTTGGTIGASLFVKRLDGNIYACGLNNRGQLGIGSTSTQLTLTLCPNLVGKNIEKIYSGFHSLGASSWAKVSGSNELYVTGFNNQYQQGMGDSTQRTSFEIVSFKPKGVIIDMDSEYDSVVGGYTCVLTDDGNLYHTGQARWGFTSDSSYRSFFSKVTNTVNG